MKRWIFYIMRNIFLFILLLVGLFSEAQVLQKEITYGRQAKRLVVDSLIAVPKDTLTVPTSLNTYPFVAIKNDTAYLWSETQQRWIQFGVAGGGFINGNCTEWVDGLSITWQGTGFNFSMEEGIVKIDCVPYLIDSLSFTLDPADTLDRFDVPYIDATGFHILKGEPSASPAIPQVQGDQVALTAILVPANSTEPDLDLQIVYDENTESVVTNSGTTTDGNNLTNTFRPVKSVNVTNINHADYIVFTKAPVLSTWDITGMDALSLHIKLKMVMPQLANLRVSFWNGNLQVSGEVVVGLNKFNVTTYQAISVPMSAFGNITNLEFNQVRFRYTSNNSTNHTGFYLDYIYFVDNLDQPSDLGGLSATLHFNGNAFTISPSETIQNGGTWNVIAPGTSAQYIDGTHTLRTFPTLLDSVGALDGRSKSALGGTIDNTTGTLHFQLANDLYPGLLSAALYTRINRNDSITNLGTGDTLLVYVSDTLLGIKSLIAGTGVTFTVTGNDITINSAAGSTPTLQQVFDTEVAGAVLTKNDSLQIGAFQLRVYGSANPLRVQSTTTSGITPAIQAVILNTNTNTVDDVLTISRQTSSTAANGIGGSIAFFTELSNGSVNENARIYSMWSDVTPASRSTEFGIRGITNNGPMTDWLVMDGTYGYLYLDTIATRAYARSVGGSGGTDFYTTSGILTSDRVVDLDGNNLSFSHSTSMEILMDATTSEISLTAVGVNIIGGPAAFGVNGGVGGSLELLGSTSGTITIQPAAAAGTYTLTLPTSDGSPSQYLQTDGSGVLIWADATNAIYAPIASPTFTGTVTIPTPFTLGATSVTSTGTQINYLSSATGTTGTTSTNIVFSTSPTLVTPTLGVASATTINKVTLTAPATGSTLTIAEGKTLTASNTITFTATDGSTLAIGGGGTLGTNAYTSTSYAPLASPTFTGTVTIPTPFTIGAVSMTSTGTQLNYLSSATGTTGTTSTNVVFSAGPTLTGTLTAATANFSGFVTASTGIAGNSTAGNSNLYVSGGITANRSTTANFLPSGVPGVGARVFVNGTTSYTMTASDAFGTITVGSTGGVTEAASGTHPLVASLILRPITVTNGVGATDVLAGLYIEGPATGVTPATASYGIWLDAGQTRLDGNVLIGGAAAGTSATSTLALFNGTIPSTSPADGIQLYAEDVASSSELKVRDEAGNILTLSPHNFTGIPEGRSEDMAWALYAEKDGTYINVDMLKLARLVEKLTGEKLVYKGATNNKPNPNNK